MKRFKRDYDKRFENMKIALDAFRNKYPSEKNPAGKAYIRSQDGGNDRRKIMDLEERLRLVLESSKRKDIAIAKYQVSIPDGRRFKASLFNV